MIKINDIQYHKQNELVMSIEQRLQKYIDEMDLIDERVIDRQDITAWKWFGVPASHQSLRDLDYGWIDNMIYAADSMECLASPCEYVRELKKWQLRGS